MAMNDYDETVDQTGGQDFYRDSFGEKITRDDETDTSLMDSLEPDPALDDERATTDLMDEEDTFNESLDDPDSMDTETDQAAMDAPQEPTEDSRAMSEKIKDRFNDLKGK